MDYKIMQQLLDKYFKGETSLREERDLQAYFCKGNVHESLLPYQPMFQVFEEAQMRKLDAAFDARLLEQLQIVDKQPRTRVLHLRVWMARAAAVLLIAAGAWWVVEKMQQPIEKPVAEAKTIDWSKYEPKTPEEAYQVLQTSLKKVSVEFNDGAETAAKNVNKVKSMSEVFN